MKTSCHPNLWQIWKSVLSCANIKLLITGSLMPVTFLLAMWFYRAIFKWSSDFVKQIHLAIWMRYLCITSYWFLCCRLFPCMVIKFYLNQCFGILLTDVQSENVVKGLIPCAPSCDDNLYRVEENKSNRDVANYCRTLKAYFFLVLFCF